MEKVIEIKHLTKKYPLYAKNSDRFFEAFNPFKKSYHKDFLALNDINFSVNKGECFGIIGTNGSGKSTLLKIITGVLSQTEGDVIVNGKVSALLELGAGFNMDYTGLENISMNCMVYGYTKEETNNLIPKICEFADIGDFINQPVKSYSSGMFARLAFAVAININPEILIVDEALSVGDIFFQAKCYKKFEEFKKMGKTILFVTHDMTSILKYCDRVMVLNRGEFIQIGNPAECVNTFKKILSDSYHDKEETKEELKEEKQIKELEDGSKWMDKLPINPQKNVYGNKKAEIIDFGLFDKNGNLTNSFDKFSTVTLKVKAIFNQDVKDPIFTFKLKNRKGLEIEGSNTWYENIEFGEIKEGTKMMVTFKFDVPLSADQYLLDISITRFENDNLEILSRNYEITTIDVISGKQNVGFVDPNCKIEFEKE